MVVAKAVVATAEAGATMATMVKPKFKTMGIKAL